MADRAIPIWPGVLVAVVVAGVYLGVASQGTLRFGPSRYHHHLLVADAWLHGQLHVREDLLAAREAEFRRHQRARVERQLQAVGRTLSDREWEGIRATEVPPMSHDWARVDGRAYGYWGPMVPALLLPYVAVCGLDASDVLFSCLTGACTVFLTFLVLRRAAAMRLVPGTTRTCVALSLLLGLGTVHFYLAVAGQVWFLSQIVAAAFETAAILFVLRSADSARWAIAAGAALGAAALSRSSVLATAPFFYITLAVWARRQSGPWVGTFVRSAAMFSAPLGVAVAVTLLFNWARFGHPLESGAGILVATGGDPRFRDEVLRFGMFSSHYVRRNIYSYFVNPWLRRHEETNALTFDPYGNSMFLVTPALLYLFRSYRKLDLFTVALWAGAGTSMLLLLTFHGSGWYGFGNRYLLDLMPLAILLIGIGMEGRLTLESGLLIALSVIANAWGTYRFCVEQVWY